MYAHRHEGIVFHRTADFDAHTEDAETTQLNRSSPTTGERCSSTSHNDFRVQTIRKREEEPKRLPTTQPDLDECKNRMTPGTALCSYVYRYRTPTAITPY